MSELAWDETAESVLQNQILRRKRVQDKCMILSSPVDNIQETLQEYRYPDLLIVNSLEPL